MSRIYWTAPTVILLSLLAGAVFAIVHHLYYASLDRRDPGTNLSGYDVLGVQMSDQQFNTAVGTALAFLVRAFLMLSISVAYFQIFIWTVARRQAGTELTHLDVMASALTDITSMAFFGSWWRRPWLWILAVVAWLIPIASIVTPATLSIGTDSPPSKLMNVPTVNFESLNYVAPMAFFAGAPAEKDGKSEFLYQYDGPSLAVQRVANAVASRGSILPVAPPAVNSTWNLTFNGPALRCKPVPSEHRGKLLTNILDYTFVEPKFYPDKNCAYGPGYTAWHPRSIFAVEPDFHEELPFRMFRSNNRTTSSEFDNDADYGTLVQEVSSIFFAVTPKLLSSHFEENGTFPSMCTGKPWYQAALAEYHDTSTVLRCDVRNSTYDITFSFVNGVQNTIFKDVASTQDTPMTTIGQVYMLSASERQVHMDLRPQACRPMEFNHTDKFAHPCLADPVVLSTLSYQAITHAFRNLLTGMITLGEAGSLYGILTSTTRLSSTVLVDSTELAFARTLASSRQIRTQTAQERAETWGQKPYSGLVNAVAEPSPSLPFQDALEQMFQNITLSLMSEQELQPNTSSIYYPNKTEVHFQTRENIYVYAANKLWLAYGLAVGSTAVIALFGLLAIIANDASYSNKFSTILRLARGAQLSQDIELVDLLGQDPLPAYAKTTVVSFPVRDHAAERRKPETYALVH